MAKEGMTATAARNRLLPEGRVAGPMPWVIAIMMFLTVLAAACGLGLGAAVRSMGSDLAGRATVQIVEANPETRTRLTGRTIAALRGTADVRAARPVAPAQLVEQLRPWLGEEATNGDLPVPALIDVELTPGHSDAKIATLRRLLAGISPAARIEPHAAFHQPLAGLLSALGWLAVGLVVLMAIATAAIVVLAARGAHDGHRSTIEVLHLMGATDVQIARLFQRRIALDALFGGAIGLVLAVIVMLVLGHRLDAIGSELLGSVGLGLRAWVLILILPLAGGLLATIAARITVIRTLRKML